MCKNKFSLIINKKITKFKKIKLTYFIFFLIFFIFFLFSLNCSLVKAGSGYVPNPPNGTTFGDINIEYEYYFYSSSMGSSWMFDWGDGNYSNWIEVKEINSYISRNYSWNSYGEYNVRIKQKNIYNQESQWSLPLLVSIAIPTDLDKDGWNNEIEESYNKNPQDPNDYPLDTDSDGIPDEDSDDGIFIGDLDDDGDGLSDLIEESLGSDKKISSDIKTISIKGNIYFLIDKDSNGYYDLFYDSKADLQTNTGFDGGKIFLDVDNDSLWEYTYYNGVISEYEEDFPWFYLIILIIVIPIVLVLILFKMGILFFYEEEYIEEN